MILLRDGQYFIYERIYVVNIFNLFKCMKFIHVRGKICFCNRNGYNLWLFKALIRHKYELDVGKI